MATVAVRRSRMIVIIMSFVAFISLGLPDGLLGVAWPSIRADFGQPLDSLGLLLLSVTTGYMLSSFYSGHIVSRIGVGWLLGLSCLATGSALLAYTVVPTWWMMVAMGLLAGLGAGAIDAGLNTYVAANHSAGLMQWLHASFGIGTTLGPIIMTTVLNGGQPWRTGYVIVGLAQVTLAVCFMLTRHRWEDGPSQQPDSAHLSAFRTPIGETLRQPFVWMSIAIFFVYTGLEVTAGQWTYSILTESRGMPIDQAGLWVSFYWGSFTMGRVTAGLVANTMSTSLLMRISMLGSLLGAILFSWNPVEAVGLAGLGIIGFSLAPVFPGLITSTAERVGARHAANTIGFQVSAASIGIGVMPGLAGVIAQRSSLEIIGPFMVVVALIMFSFYSFILWQLGKDVKRKLDETG